jgi:hypothetical protein
VALSPDYGLSSAADLGDAFWLVESPANRAIAEIKWRAKATDRNSAVFKSGGDPADVESLFETVDLHHPNWSQIDFFGALLTDRSERYFQNEGLQVSRSDSGFVLTRALS